MERTSIYTDSTPAERMQPAAYAVAQLCKAGRGPVALQDNRPATAGRQQVRQAMHESPHVHQLKQRAQLLTTASMPVQRKANTTGLPDQLKSGIEHLSGYSMDDVKVHYNSSQPAQLQAHAYAQGADIHVAPGREQHLPHEAWHVVQQKQGRVKPTLQLKSIPVNDDSALEKEADKMGDEANALNTAFLPPAGLSASAPVQRIVQRLPAPLDPERDIGKLYRMTRGGLSREIVIGRFESLGRTGMHNFIQVGGDEDGEALRVHYANIIGEVEDNGPQEEELPPADGRSIDPEKMFASRMEPEVVRERRSRKQPNPKRHVRIDMDRIRTFVTQYRQQFEGRDDLSLGVRNDGQRVDLNAENSDVLMALLRQRGGKKKGARKFIDPTYHETGSYVDTEFGVFAEAAEAAGLNTTETHEAYNLLMRGQVVTSGDNEISSSWPSPLTAMTPSIANMYQNAHYRSEIIRRDATSSTRAYETDFTAKIFERVPFTAARAFSITSAEKREPSMITSVGATLDIQTPTSGTSIGMGKVTSVAYKYFQRSMELLNQQLDQTEAYDKTQPDAFDKRTKLHLDTLDDHYTAGIYENERSNFDNRRGYDTFDELVTAINELLALINASLASVPEEEDAPMDMPLQVDQLQGNRSRFVKQLELIGSMLGLMIKKEKRQLLNAQMVGSDAQVKERLINLYKLHRVESEINRQISDSEKNIGKMIRDEGSSRSFAKDVDTLND